MDRVNECCIQNQLEINNDKTNLLLLKQTEPTLTIQGG